MTLRTVVALAVCALALLGPAVDHRQRILRQHGDPGADLCAVCAVDQHDARLRRHGLARPRRLPRHCRLCLHPRRHRRLRPPHGGDLRDRGVDRGGGVFRAAVAARARPRLHHDHARARPDRLGHRLSGERPHRRRQRHQVSRASDAVRFRPPRRTQLLLFHARRLRRRAVLHLALLALPVRREPDGHARPAAAHAHARLQCLADPVAHVRHGRVLGLGRRRPLRLLQSVPQPARDLAAAIGRDPADGDPRRRQHAHRPDRRRRHHHAGEERDLDLCRALEHAARRDLRGRDHVHALRPRSRLHAAMAAIAKPGQDAQGGERHRAGERSERPARQEPAQ